MSVQSGVLSFSMAGKVLFQPLATVRVLRNKHSGRIPIRNISGVTKKSQGSGINEGSPENLRAAFVLFSKRFSYGVKLTVLVPEYTVPATPEVTHACVANVVVPEVAVIG